MMGNGTIGGDLQCLSKGRAVVFRQDAHRSRPTMEPCPRTFELIDSICAQVIVDLHRVLDVT
jgi:hypothetical protein